MGNHSLRSGWGRGVRQILLTKTTAIPSLFLCAEVSRILSDATAVKNRLGTMDLFTRSSLQQVCGAQNYLKKITGFDTKSYEVSPYLNS